MVPLDHFPFSIGRDKKNDLQLHHWSVSRRHATIIREGRSPVIVDEKSRNGVWVNQRRIAKKRIRDGDRVCAGSVEMRVWQVPSLKIPADSTHGDSVYFPHRKDWDPIQTLSEALPTGKFPAVRKKVTPEWQELLRISLESGTPETYDRILEALQRIVAFNRCFILLFEEGSTERFKVVARRFGLDPLWRSRSPRASEIFVSREVLRRVGRRREAVLVSREDQDIRDRESFIRTGADSAVCLPLVLRGKVSGVLYLDRTSDSPGLRQDDLDVLGPLAGIVALKIENVQLLQAYLASQLDKKELEIAETIQQRLYPEPTVCFPGFAVEGYTSPCYQVGGDYFDFFPRGDSELIWALGDVSGKGLSAAIYMVSVLSTLRAHIKDGIPLEVLMARLEQHVRETFRSDYFLTLFLAKLDRNSGVLTYCNAGHIPPLVFQRNGEVFELKGSDPALNILPWQDFECYEYRFAPGDLLVAYTDGLVEGQGKNGEQFGHQRAVSYIRRMRDRDLVSIRSGILSEVEAFTSDAGLHDDVTLVFLRREEE